MPELEFKQTNFLVVEGFISVGPDAVTTIQLSRTIPLNEPLTEPLWETGAGLFIEDDQGNAYPLTEKDDGKYVSDSLSLPVDREYRLKITTDDEHTYSSDFLTPIITPAIDSVSWTTGPEEGPIDAFEIHVATHDPEDKIHYYQWNYEEVWERRMRYVSAYRYENGTLIFRESEEGKKLRKCWERASAPALITESTLQLQVNAISLKLISFPLHSVRLDRKYSVLVTQNALSQEVYNYLQLMKKNSTSLGTFFDPQPSELYGNIRSTNSSEPVIGYMGVYQPSSVRLTIFGRDEIPWWHYDPHCNVFLVSTHPDSLLKYFGSYVNIPLIPVGTPPPSAITGTHKSCVDCRTWGGNNEKPPFWDNGEEEEEEEEEEN